MGRRGRPPITSLRQSEAPSEPIVLPSRSVARTAPCPPEEQNQERRERHALVDVEDRRARYNRDFAAMRAAGVNTIEGWFENEFDEVTLDAATAQLVEELIDKLRKGGAQVVLCSCTCRVEGYNPDDAMDRIAKAMGCAVEAMTFEPYPG